MFLNTWFAKARTCLVNLSIVHIYCFTVAQLLAVNSGVNTQKGSIPFFFAEEKPSKRQGVKRDQLKLRKVFVLE